MYKYAGLRNRHKGAMYLISPELMISGASFVHIPNAMDRVWDEELCRAVATAVTGFQDRRYAYSEIEEAAYVVKDYYEVENYNRRESFTMRSTYDYEADSFDVSCDLTEYRDGEKLYAAIYMEDVNMKMLKKLDRAVRAWHKTGELFWEGIFIHLVLLPEERKIEAEQPKQTAADSLDENNWPF